MVGQKGGRCFQAGMNGRQRGNRRVRSRRTAREKNHPSPFDSNLENHLEPDDAKPGMEGSRAGIFEFRLHLLHPLHSPAHRVSSIGAKSLTPSVIGLAGLGKPPDSRMLVQEEECGDLPSAYLGQDCIHPRQARLTYCYAGGM